MVAATPAAAWAGPHKHAAPRASRTTTFNPTGFYGSGNPSYGWVIPITFVYAPGYGPG